MDTLMKADIFFFITSIAVVLLTLMLTLVLFYVVKILRDVKYISNLLKKGTERVEGHIENLYEMILNNPILNFIFKQKKKKTKKKEDN